MIFLRYKFTGEGAGAQYQRIIGIIALCAKYGFIYNHQLIKIGHNYENIENWDTLWDDFFNIKQINTNLPDTCLVFKDVHSLTYTHINDLLNFKNDINNNYILNLNLVNEICDAEPNDTYGLILNDIRYLYVMANKDYILDYDFNYINIAIHIRVVNDNDDQDAHNQLEVSNGSRFVGNEKTYINLINKLKIKYTNAYFHIFTQNTDKIENIKKINNLKIYMDTDVFYTLHHLINADVLVIAKSSFSYLAGIYNQKTVMYFPFYHSPLKNWINIDNI